MPWARTTLTGRSAALLVAIHLWKEDTNPSAEEREAEFRRIVAAIRAEFDGTAVE